MKRKISLSLVGVIAFILFTPITSANASASCPQGSIVYDRNTKKPETFEQYFKRLTVRTESCRKESQTEYNRQVQKFVEAEKASTLTEFNRRYLSCMGKTSLTAFNIGSWGLSIRCIFTTSFFPSSAIIKNGYKDIGETFNSHQPTSYIKVATTVFSGVKNNWGTMSCNSNSLAVDMTFPGMTGETSFNIPCQPPTALKGFRALQVFALWLSFVFFVYFVAVKFWERVQS